MSNTPQNTTCLSSLPSPLLLFLYLFLFFTCLSSYQLSFPAQVVQVLFHTLLLPLSHTPTSPSSLFYTLFSLSQFLGFTHPLFSSLTHYLLTSPSFLVLFCPQTSSVSHLTFTLFHTHYFLLSSTTTPFLLLVYLVFHTLVSSFFPQTLLVSLIRFGFFHTCTTFLFTSLLTFSHTHISNSLCSKIVPNTPLPALTIHNIFPKIPSLCLVLFGCRKFLQPNTTKQTHNLKYFQPSNPKYCPQPSLEKRQCGQLCSNTPSLHLPSFTYTHDSSFLSWVLLSTCYIFFNNITKSHSLSI